MSFSSHNRNPLPQLVELNTRTVEGNDDATADIFATLQIRSDEIDIGNYTIEVQFSQAYIVVEVEGCHTCPNTKHGMRKIPEIVERRVESEKNAKATVSGKVLAEATVSGKVSPIDYALEVSAGASIEASGSTEIGLINRETRIHVHIPVESVGADRWQVTQEDGGALSGNYLTDSRLCRIIKNDGRPNRYRARITAQVKRKHITANVTQKRRRIQFGANKDKLLSIMVAKCLGEVAQDRDSQAITFSASETDYEG